MFVWASPRFRSGLKSDNLATNAILPPQLGQTEKKRMIPELQTVRFGELALDSGETLRDVEVAYESYGQLNDRKSNAILIVHAFTGDAHAAGPDKDGAPGWWSSMIGPGKAFDTDRYFVLCSNVLGGCRGTTGPSSIDPATGKPYGMSFPVITIGDMVRLQHMLVQSLGISRLLAVAGGSMGGMQALEWAVSFPDAVYASIPIATTGRHTAQQIAFNEVGRQAIVADPDFQGGSYYESKPPARGLAVARMVGHITYMSDESMREKFGRKLRGREEFSYGFGVDFEVESYLRYRGSQFVGRFDANSYLYITKAMDYFDLSSGYPSLGASLERAQCRFLVISFTSDWLYPSYQSLEIVNALRSRNHDVTYCELTSTYGHDAFLVDVKDQTGIVRGFLARCERELEAAP
jgi:homoserine O-acetyltransferase